MNHLQSPAFSFNPALVTRLMAICWLIMKLFCYQLWLGDHDFPLAPVYDSWLQVPPIVHGFLFAVMLAGLPALVLFPSKKWLILLILVAETGSCMLDQNRIKPWEYQFLFMLLPLLFFKDEKRIKISWQIILVGIYFFSGVSKCNPGFILRVWNQMILHEWMGITTQDPWIYRLGYLLPVIEMAAALALLFNRTRKWGAGVICLMHVIIIIILGPSGSSYTYVLLTWNLLMIFILIHLFYSNHFNWALLPQKQWLVWCIALFWWVMPWFNLAGFWDDYFSAVLYSGKSQSLYICTSNAHTKKVYAPYFVATGHGQPCDTMLSLTAWSMQTLHNIPYPEERVYQSIIRQWKLKNDPAGTDRFFILFPKHAKGRWVEIK